jgi:hypothetical protein
VCGEANQCGAERGDSNCWCFSIRISEGVIARVPPEAQNVACVCERCAAGKRSPAEIQPLIERRTQEH